MKLFVVIATVGRAKLTKFNVMRLFDQTEPPDGIVVCGAADEDIAGVGEGLPLTSVMIGPKGSCHQRNTALETVIGKADIVTFIDDDFIAQDDYLEQVRRFFEANPKAVGVTGHLIADGALNEGIELGAALDMLSERSNARNQGARMDRRQALYGCNMSLRASAIAELRFDENLPLYAWQEDIDFSYQVGRRGELYKTDSLIGVHLGTKRGRTSGVRFGYSQVANILYLNKKGTLQPGLGRKLMTRNVVSNVIRSVRPESYVDRRGRLKGNLIAFIDVLRGRNHPKRILDL